MGGEQKNRIWWVQAGEIAEMIYPETGETKRFIPFVPVDLAEPDPSRPLTVDDVWELLSKTVAKKS